MNTDHHPGPEDNPLDTHFLTNEQALRRKALIGEFIRAELAASGGSIVASPDADLADELGVAAQIQTGLRQVPRNEILNIIFGHRPDMEFGFTRAKLTHHHGPSLIKLKLLGI